MVTKIDDEYQFNAILSKYHDNPSEEGQRGISKTPIKITLLLLPEMPTS